MDVWFYLISVLCVVLAIAYLYFSFYPTRHWFNRIFHLYLFFDGFDDISELTPKEIELRLHLLILDKCVERSEMLDEIRNGYLVRYVPEVVKKNKRIMPQDYIEIYDSTAQLIVKVGFNGNGQMRAQVDCRNQNDLYTQMFLTSGQGKCLDDLCAALNNRDSKMMICNRYINWLISQIL